MAEEGTVTTSTELSAEQNEFFRVFGLSVPENMNCARADTLMKKLLERPDIQDRWLEHQATANATKMPHAASAQERAPEQTTIDGKVMGGSRSNTTPTEDKRRDDYALFVGAKAERYVPIFQQFDNGGTSRWNWAAALFGPTWMAYRRMYLWGFVLGPIVGVGLMLLSYAALKAMSGDAAIASVSILLGRLAGFILFGLTGDSIYYRHTRRCIDDVNVLSLSDSTRQRTLSAKGGTSVVFLLIALLISVLMAAFVAAAATDGLGKEARMQSRLSELDSILKGARDTGEDSASTEEPDGSSSDVESSEVADESDDSSSAVASSDVPECNGDGTLTSLKKTLYQNTASLIQGHMSALERQLESEFREGWGPFYSAPSYANEVWTIEAIQQTVFDADAGVRRCVARVAHAPSNAPDKKSSFVLNYSIAEADWGEYQLELN